MATVLRESGRAGSAGASVAVLVAVGVAAVAGVVAGTAADDVAPAPARSQGFGGEPPVAMSRRDVEVCRYAADSVSSSKLTLTQIGAPTTASRHLVKSIGEVQGL